MQSYEEGTQVQKELSDNEDEFKPIKEEDEFSFSNESESQPTLKSQRLEREDDEVKYRKKNRKKEGIRNKFSKSFNVQQSPLKKQETKKQDRGVWSSIRSRFQFNIKKVGISKKSDTKLFKTRTPRLGSTRTKGRKERLISLNVSKDSSKRHSNTEEINELTEESVVNNEICFQSLSSNNKGKAQLDFKNPSSNLIVKPRTKKSKFSQNTRFYSKKPIPLNRNPLKKYNSRPKSKVIVDSSLTRKRKESFNLEHLTKKKDDFL